MKLFTIAFTLIFGWLSFTTFSQTHVSCEWQQVMSSGGGGGSGGGAGPGLGGTIVTGNYNEQIFVTRLTASGQILWNYLHPPTGALAFGSRVEVDPYGSLGVLALHQIDSAGYEATVLRIDSTGILEWAATYTNSYDDIPVDLDFDSLGNTYVAIASKNALDNYDYRLVKYDSLGSVIWDTSYNFAGLEDVPVSVHVNPSGDIIVCGGSQDSTGLYQFTTVVFDDSGSFISDTRVSTSLGAPEQVTSAFQDDAGNLYLTGRSGFPGTNTDIKIVKLNSSNALEWIAQYDGYGSDDVGADIAVDSDGNVLVSGELTSESLNYKSVVLKYDSSGSLIWSEDISSADGTVNNLPQTLSVGTDGKIAIVTSEVDDSLQPVNSTVRQYTPDGQLLWGRTLGTTGTKPRSMFVDLDGSIVVTSIEPDSTMSTSSFTTLVMDSTAVYDTDSLALFKQHELVVRFDGSAINRSNIDESVDKGIDFADLSYFLTEEAMGKIDTVLSRYCTPTGKLNPCGIQAVKVFKTMRTTDTLTFTKSGDSLRIPDFYTMLLLKLPEDYDLWGTHQALELLPKYIAYSEPNFIVHTQSSRNDPSYIYQYSLHDTVPYPYPDGNVNVESAWNIYPEAGNKRIRVGIMDEGLNFRHEDFGYVPSQPNSGKMVDGWSYLTDVNLKTLSNPDDGHGTPVAGIIGARSNDNMGIAGIAGGDVASDDSSGVSLYGIKIIQAADVNYFFANPVTYVYDAFYNSCLSQQPGAGFNQRYFDLDIINCSWGITSASSYWSDTNFNALRESVKFASDRQITVVAAHGNTDVNNQVYYPSNLWDPWVISVGGSDNDGEHYARQTFVSCWGENLDLIAPMSKNLVVSTQDSTTGHLGFEGTSAATAHVTGACALMMSYHNDLGNIYQYLNPEDNEYIVEQTATDVGDPYWDTLTAYGRLNIGAAMELLHAPDYKVIHYGTTNAGSNSTTTSHTTQLASNFPIVLYETFQLNSSSNPNVPNPWYHAGNYTADVYRVDFTVEHDIPSGYTAMDAWPRHSSSVSFDTLAAAAHYLVPRNYIKLNDWNQDSTRLTAYTYYVYDSLGVGIGWWPNLPVRLTGEYSLLLRSNTLELQNKEIASKIKLFPNPSHESHNLEFTCEPGEKITIQLYSLDGRLIKTPYDKISNEQKLSIHLEINDLTSGVYFYRIDKASGSGTIKFLKD